MNSSSWHEAARPGTAAGREAGPRATHVIKTLAPGSPGAQKLALRYGADLVCVRHRVDAGGRQRITTVELVVDVSEIRSRGRAEPELALRLAMGEQALRASIQQAGGRWDAAARVWWLRRSQVLALGLKGRVVDGTTCKNG